MLRSVFPPKVRGENIAPTNHRVGTPVSRNNDDLSPSDRLQDIVSRSSGGCCSVSSDETLASDKKALKLSR